MSRSAYMSLAEVKALKSGDCSGCMGVECTIEESGPVLEKFYENTPRWNHGSQTGKFWEKVGEHADLLRDSNDGSWPFPPLELGQNGTWLYDGHHRANAAIMVDWPHPIPVEVW
ncbi:ParB-like nuclease domain protein [Mycobacterium phage Yecey3]|uniref:ParB-like nuclease domain protein n=1 Tax=Mycobacterium phage Yecey3 TaxID=2656617 RepID=A0A649V906_9CAUD|nr:hypothetical protein KIV58_gp022 [Mycobacterium phage Yecey3]QGJ88838.1 ParB-like nuclease domain protein [Mycobacterium phage Yecey3]